MNQWRAATGSLQVRWGDGLTQYLRHMRRGWILTERKNGRTVGRLRRLGRITERTAKRYASREMRYRR